MAGVLKGKFGYMSPEQVRGLPLDRRSDIFALGTMLYECLTGDRLFQGETDFSTLEKVRNVDIRAPRDVNPNIPAAVEAVILKALAKDVEDRYQWCSEMLADLQAFLMAQEVVFTAKSLSSWLKEVFSTEIDRERQQLEQYKRVGRDGLIDGLPAADVKVDIVERLGEAGPLEGDPTVLGEPSFDDIERVASGPAEVGPAPGSPAARGLEDDEDGEAFGEEAPTEIFGEINHGSNPVTAPALPSARAATSQPPQTRPPRPPPSSRLPTMRGDAQPLAAQPAGGPPNTPAPRPSGHLPPRPGQMQPRQGPPHEQGPPGLSMQSYANPANAGSGYPSFPSGPSGPPGSHGPSGQPGQPGQPGMPPPSHAMAQTLVPNSSQPIALGTPGAPGPQPVNGLVPPNQAATLLGATPPPGLRNHVQGYPPPGPHPGHAMPPPPMPPPGYGGPHYPPPHHPYATPGFAVVPPVEQVPPVTAAKRSSIVRDVAIGVAIAALVLGGFLVVKFLILDERTAAPPAPASAIATIRLELPEAISAAELFVDDRRIATVGDKQEISITAGQRKVKLVGPKGALCEKQMMLAAGKVTTLDCAIDASAPASAGASAKPADAAPSMPSVGSASTSVGPASTSGTGSATTPPVGSGSAAAVDDKAKAATAVDDKAKPAAAVDDKAKPATAADDKAKPADKPAVDAKPAPKTDKPRQPERPKVERQAKPPTEEDPLGKLQGGSKPGDAKPETKKPGEPARAAADAKGYLAVISKPVAKIFVDGVDTGLSTPISGQSLPLAPGKHRVTFVINNDKDRITFVVTIKPGEITTLQKDL
jgi:eukaryotic-like serine/threonine-protein kinase